MKLGLGTVQFGQQYGVSNSQGKTSPEEVARILRLAEKIGVSVLDTAPLYGDSEAVLGACLPWGHAFHLVTKTPQFAGFDVGDVAAAVDHSFRASLQRLRQPTVYGLLVHNAADLLSANGDAIFSALEALRSDGRVTKIGVSAYSPQEIEDVLARYPVDLVQIPVNVFDQRLIRSGHLGRLKSRGVEVHARSIFLQGLLLLQPDALASYFSGVRAHLGRYREAVHALGMTPLQGALAFVAAIPEVDVMVCGVTREADLAEIHGALRADLKVDFGEFAIDAPEIVEPRRWILR
ncbi:MAG: aldo/keto reductase [Sulfurifustaceae bacterium]